MLDNVDIGGLWLAFALSLTLAGAFLLGRRNGRVELTRAGGGERARGGGRNRPRLALSIALLIAGIGVLMFANADEIGFEARRLGLDVPGLALAAPAPAADASTGTSTATGASATSSQGAWLTIPRLGISVPIGTEQEAAMRRGAFLHAGSARPGESGNVVLAGHRRHDVFTLLHRVEQGDVVTVRWKGKTYRYRVAEKHRATPTDTQWIKRAGRDRLTMYTCIPRYLGNKRTVVVAYPISETPAP